MKLASEGVDFHPIHGCAETLEACTTSCEQGSGAACTDVGERYRTANGVKRDLARAYGFFDKACKKGIGVPVDYARGQKTSEKACTGGNAEGCYNLGVMQLRGYGVPVDKAKAKAFFTQGCKMGMQQSCESVSSAQ